MFGHRHRWRRKDPSIVGPHPPGTMQREATTEKREWSKEVPSSSRVVADQYVARFTPNNVEHTTASMPYWCKKLLHVPRPDNDC